MLKAVLENTYYYSNFIDKETEAQYSLHLLRIWTDLLLM